MFMVSIHSLLWFPAIFFGCVSTHITSSVLPTLQCHSPSNLQMSPDVLSVPRHLSLSAICNSVSHFPFSNLPHLLYIEVSYCPFTKCYLFLKACTLMMYANVACCWCAVTPSDFTSIFREWFHMSALYDINLHASSTATFPRKRWINNKTNI